LGLGFGFRFWV